MNYNLKDKLIVMIALSFAATMTVSRVSYAEDAAPVVDVAAQANVAGETAEIDTSFLNDTEGEDAGVKANISVEDHMVPNITDDADDAEDTDVTDVKKPAETVKSNRNSMPWLPLTLRLKTSVMPFFPRSITICSTKCPTSKNKPRF